MTTAIAELETVIQLVEARIPANQRSLKNLRLRKRLTIRLAKYFRDLSKAFPYGKLAGIYNRHVAKESFQEAGPIGDAGDIISPLLRMFRAKLIVDIIGHQVGMYMSASAEVTTWGKTKAGIPIAFEGPPVSQAITWAEKHGAKLVTQMDQETKRRLAHVVGDGIKNKRGIPGLSRDIRDTFSLMTKHRSELIARTETANALSQASLDTMKEMGIDGKEWVTAGDDLVSDECNENEAQGVIPLANQFSGGVGAPPQHPDCRCAIAPARLRR